MLTRQVFEIRRVSHQDQGFMETLSLAVSESRPTDMTVDAWLADLLDQRDFDPLGQGLVIGAFTESTLYAAAVAVESRGHCALVFFGAVDNSPEARSAIFQCLSVIRETAKTTTVEILQVIVGTDDRQSGEMLQLAGFKYITKLTYFIKTTKNDAADVAIAIVGESAEITWLSYSHENKRMFCEALDASYLGSFDCPELAGMRKTEDVLLGHRPRGSFDPSLWQVAMRAGQPLGILLLNSLSPQRAMEIVYIGVSPPARGTGVSDALMARTLAAAKRLSLDFVTLAVDVRNKPALALYDRWRFERCLERDAWLAVR